MRPNRVHLLNIPEMDEDHLALGHIVAELEAAEENQASTAEVASIFTRLIDATREHFIREERMMAFDQFPFLEDHREQHKRLLAYIELLRRELIQSGTALDKETVVSIWDWSLSHMDTIDREYAEYLHRRMKASY